MISIRSCVVGMLGTNCYILQNSTSQVVIDAGGDPEIIVKELSKSQLPVKSIVCTHGHYDHIGAIAVLKKKYSVPVYMHEAEKALLEWSFNECGIEHFAVDEWLGSSSAPILSETFKGGQLDVKMMHTPGHTPGCVCFYTDDFIITGDTLFAEGSWGRTDLFCGNEQSIRGSLKQILALPEQLVVYPGHGPSSTIKKEREYYR